MFLVSSCSWLCPIHWSQVLRCEWRCSWSSADRRWSLKVYGKVMLAFLQMEMLSITCCALLLIFMPWHTVGRAVFTHRPLYNERCGMTGRVLSHRDTDDPHHCMLDCLRWDECWEVQYRITRRRCHVHDGLVLLAWSCGSSEIMRRTLGNFWLQSQATNPRIHG